MESIRFEISWQTLMLTILIACMTIVHFCVGHAIVTELKVFNAQYRYVHKLTAEVK